MRGEGGGELQYRRQARLRLRQVKRCSNPSQSWRPLLSSKNDGPDKRFILTPESDYT